MSLLNDDELFAALDADIQSIADAKADAESCELFVSMANAIEQAVIAKLATVSVEPCAVRHSFDGYGYLYGDSGSGSLWKERAMAEPNAEPVYTQEALAAARVQAIEGAAKICECQWSTLEERDAGIEFAEAIRELIGGEK